MTDREKVIKALECAIQYGPHYCGGEFGDENEYSRIGQNVLMDAIALLKAQESIQIIKVGYYDHGKCPKCDRYVSRYSNFCWYCGQAVKWE